MDGNETNQIESQTITPMGPEPTKVKLEVTPKHDRWWNEEKPKAKSLTRTEDGFLIDSYGRAYTRDFKGTLRRVK